MGNDRTTRTPSGQGERDRWSSDPNTVERRDRELADRFTDREPVAALANDRERGHEPEPEADDETQAVAQSMATERQQ